MTASANRFDFIRLVLASIVFVFHALVLAKEDPTGTGTGFWMIAAEISIQTFFIISGTLVYGSWLRSKSVDDYVEKRFRRLYPAYFVVIIVPVLFSFVLTFGQDGALQHIGRYLLVNLAFLNFLEPTLPGLFQDNNMPAVNGALWTLKIEVMFYFSLPIIALVLKKLGRYWWVGIAAMIAGAFVWYEVALGLDTSFNKQLSRQLPGQMMYFAAGMLLWKLMPLAKEKSIPLLIGGAVLLGVSLLSPHLEPLRVIALTALVAGVAFAPGPSLEAARWGDVSYGVYIVHFPVVQTLAAIGVFSTLGLYGGLAVSAFLTYGLSFVLWWWVEKPALRRDSYYRKASETETKRDRVRDNPTGRHTGRDSRPNPESPQ